MKMSLKYRLTLIVAAASLLLTLAAGLSAQIRLPILLYRTAVSVVFLSGIGYFAGRWLENKLRLMLNNEQPGQKIDVVSQPPESGQASFDPFTVNDFERIERK